MESTVHGRNPKQPPGMVLKPVVKQWDFNYQPQLVQTAGFLKHQRRMAGFFVFVANLV